MDLDTQREITPELQGGEHLLWSGRPAQGLRLTGADVVMIPGSLLWGGFAFWWEYMVLTQSRGPLILKLWGIPFVLVGAYMIVGRFFGDALVRARTVYGVTTQRILIISTLFSRRVQTIPLATLGNLSYRARSDGSGTIALSGDPAGSPAAVMIQSSARRLRTPQLEVSDNVRQVYDMILKAQQDLRGAAGAS